jgi:hypothetical protein
MLQRFTQLGKPSRRSYYFRGWHRFRSIQTQGENQGSRGLFALAASE